MDDLKEKLNNLRKLETEAEDKLHDVRKARHLVELAIAKRDYGVEVGSIVRESGDLYRVTKVRPWPDSPPWLSGHKQIKDGTFSGARRFDLYGKWELVEGEGRP